MKKKTMIEEMRERANKLSNGEALILLDHILKREGQEAMISIFMNEMPQIKNRIIMATSILKVVEISTLS